MNDITTIEDVELLVSDFYKKLLNDSVTKTKFTHLNIEDHLPKIVDFWAFILLDKPGYSGNVFEKHISLNLEPVHFEKWVAFWTETVNVLFSGPKADLACQRAMLLSYTFQSKLFNKGESRIL